MWSSIGYMPQYLFEIESVASCSLSSEIRLQSAISELVLDCQYEFSIRERCPIALFIDSGCYCYIRTQPFLNRRFNDQKCLEWMHACGTKPMTRRHSDIFMMRCMCVWVILKNRWAPVHPLSTSLRLSTICCSLLVHHFGYLLLFDVHHVFVMLCYSCSV